MGAPSSPRSGGGLRWGDSESPSPSPREIVPTSRDFCFAKISRGKFPSHSRRGWVQSFYISIAIIVCGRESIFVLHDLKVRNYGIAATTFPKKLFAEHKIGIR